MTDDLQSSDYAEAEPLHSAERHDITPFRAIIDDLVTRYHDATTKAVDFENQAHNMEMQLRRTKEAAAYKRKLAAGIERRIITGRAALRAWEDESSGIME